MLAILRSTVGVSVMNFTGLLLGFLLNLYIARKFGAGKYTDALFIAISIPNLFVYLAGLDSIRGITRTFVIDYKYDKARLQQYIENLLTPILLVSLALFLAVVIFSDVIAGIVAPGVDVETARYISRFVRVLSFSVLLAGTTNLFVAIINAFDRYTEGAIIMLAQKVIIFMSIMLVDRFGIITIPAAYSIGAVVSCLVGWRIVKSVLDIRVGIGGNILSADIKEFLGLFRPLFISVFVVQLCSIAYTIYNSFMDSGTITAFNYSKSLSSAILPLAVVPFLSVFLNRLRAIKDDKTQCEKDIVKYYYYILNISVAICVSLFLCAEPLVKVLFLRGEFTLQDARNVTGFYQCFLVGTVLQGICLYFNYIALSRHQTGIILWSNIFVLAGVTAPLLTGFKTDTTAVYASIILSWLSGCMVYAYYAYREFKHVIKPVAGFTLVSLLFSAVIVYLFGYVTMHDNSQIIVIIEKLTASLVSYAALFTIMHWAVRKRKFI